MALMVSYIAATRIFTCIIASFLIEIDRKFENEQIPFFLPGETVLAELLETTAAECLSVMRMKCRDSLIHFACDGSNKKGTHHMIKSVSFYHWAQQKFYTFQLDCDATGGKNNETAKGINSSFKKLDFTDGTKEKMYSLSSDLGGGGTGKGLQSSLEGYGRLKDPQLFRTVTCCLHALSLTFASPIEKFFLLGGLHNRTMLQMLFSLYALENLFDRDEILKVWIVCNGTPYPGRMKQPVLTCWEYVGLSIEKFTENMSKYVVFAQSLVNSYKTDNAKNEVASDFLSLAKEPAIITMIYFVQGFYNAFWKSNFHILKQKDPILDRSGYIVRHMAIIYYCMQKELTLLSVEYKTNIHFKTYYDQQHLHVNNKEEREIFKDLPRLFFEDSLLMLKKHFKQWSDDLNLPFLLASEPPIATAFSRWILELPITDETIFYNFNKKEINVPSFISFITEESNRCFIKTTPEFRDMSAIASIANGAKWQDMNLKKHIYTAILPILAHTQMIESYIKDVQLCKTSGRNEKTISHMTMLRSIFIQETRDLLFKDKAYIHRN